MKRRTNAELALAFSTGEGNSGLKLGLEEILFGLVVLLHEQIKHGASLVSDHLFRHIAVREDLEAKDLQDGSTLITVPTNNKDEKQVVRNGRDE